MAYSLSIEPYRTDRSDFRITVNKEAAKLIQQALMQEAKASSSPISPEEDMAWTIQSALERWK